MTKRVMSEEQKQALKEGAARYREKMAARAIDRAAKIMADREQSHEIPSEPIADDPRVIPDRPDFVEFPPGLDDPPALEEKSSEIELADFERQAISDGVLDLEDILKARIEARNKVLLEQKTAAKKKLVDRMVEEERRAAGLIPAETEHRKWLDEMVSYTVRLPKQGPRDVPEHRVDQRVFTNGRTYEVTRAEYQSLIATEQLAWHHQAQIMGQSRTYFDELLGSMVYMGGVALGAGAMA